MSETTTSTTTLTEYEFDPRPDLFQDHAEWMAILDLAAAEGSDIHGILHALRCGGAVLSPSPKYGLVMLPGAWGEEAYKAFKAQSLAPRTAQVLRLLQAASVRAKDKGGPAWQRPTTLKEAVVKKVEAIEGRLKAAGWSYDEIWKEGDFKAPDYHMMQSVYQTLMNSEGCWAVGQITVESVELRWGPRGREVVNKVYRVCPAVGKQTTLGLEGNMAGNQVGNEKEAKTA